MGKTLNENILFEPQREKAGAETFQKYSYQYHWALYRVLSEHEESKEYAVFVELHEDVIVSNSLDVEKAKFEFNQVKTVDYKFSPTKLLTKKNGKSVLGKLISSGLEKKFSSKINFLNLVSLNNFSLELKDDKLTLDKIRLEDLSENQFKFLENAIKKELSIDSLPTNIQFIVPNLTESKHQDELIACISKIITSIYPESRYNSVSIYQVLIDEIYRKGQLKYDFSKWDELLTKKALTSITVKKVITDFTNIKDEGKIDIEFSSLCEEMNLTSIQAKKLKRPFNRYRRNRISNTSTNQIDITKKILNVIEKNMNDGVIKIEQLINNAINELPEKLKANFTTNDELKAAILCEFIMLD